MKKKITDLQLRKPAAIRKRRKGIGKEIVSLLLVGTLFFGSVPAAAEELFGDGQQSGESVQSAGSVQSEEAEPNAETVQSDSGTANGGFVQEESAQTADDALGDGTAEAVTDTDLQPETDEETAEEVSADEETGADSAFSSSEDDSLFADGSTGTDRTLTDEEIAEQLAPMEDLTEILVVEEPQESSNTNRGYSQVRSGSTDSLPSKYDNRSMVTDVKNQKPYGMCWAYTTASSLETSLLMQGLGSFDLSEEHLAYFFSHRQNDPLGNTADDINTITTSGTYSYRNGGNQILATLFLSSWSGMALESQVSYDTAPSASLAYSTTAYLTEAAYQAKYSVSTVKSMIYEYGSVGLSLYFQSTYQADDGSVKTIYDAEKCAYSCPVSKTANHAVTLVGWDDSYSKDNFPEDCNVQSDGAWIAKNSWGSSWGDGGYFYISYENKSNYNMVAVAGTTNPTYSNNYFYDGSCAISSITLKTADSDSGVTGGANVFVANAGDGKAEVLGEVVVETYSSNSLLGIQVYTNLTDPDDPTSGVPAYSSPVEFYQEYAGISTVSVPEVTLVQGTLYSVVITNLGTDSVSYLVETDAEYKTNGVSWVKMSAGISPEQSFCYEYVTVTENGKSYKSWEWVDLATLDTPICLRIKAHTRTLDSALSISAPSSTSASSASYNQIKLSWSGVTGASGYEICRKAPGGSWQKIAEVSYNSRSYTDKTVDTGTKYTYKIRAFCTVNGETVYGKFSGEVQARAVLATPSVTVAVSNKLYNSISWGQISGAAGYYVYRRAAGGTWKQIASVKKNVFTWRDEEITATASYEYTVRAWRKVSGTVVKSGYKSSGTYKASAAAQSVKSVKNVTSGIKITWSPQKSCDGYYIYRRTNSGKWERIARISSGKRYSYTDKTVESGKKYTYYVRAYVKEPGGTVFSRYVKSGTILRQ